VLLDGRRSTPSNASGVTDITTIPSSAIERVEVISGGASATYGADAVAGVTNFILKKNFQGVELDGRVSITEEGRRLRVPARRHHGHRLPRRPRQRQPRAVDEHSRSELPARPRLVCPPA
jgi:outer membrane receptor protein involved in Fe transport